MFAAPPWRVQHVFRRYRRPPQPRLRGWQGYRGLAPAERSASASVSTSHEPSWRRPLMKKVGVPATPLAVPLATSSAMRTLVVAVLHQGHWRAMRSGHVVALAHRNDQLSHHGLFIRVDRRRSRPWRRPRALPAGRCGRCPAGCGARTGPRSDPGTTCRRRADRRSRSRW